MHKNRLSKVIVVCPNIRSIANIGSIFRTMSCFGFTNILFSGYTPYPSLGLKDNRLPHIRDSLTKKIQKIALVDFNDFKINYSEDIIKDIKKFKSNGYKVIALEQSEDSILFKNLTKDNLPGQKLIIILGEEVHGLKQDILEISDDIIEIEHLGTKESLNVSIAFAILASKLHEVLN
jgi:tRNA G18 (ribose-2'-O)-methylase SpoU